MRCTPLLTPCLLFAPTLPPLLSRLFFIACCVEVNVHIPVGWRSRDKCTGTRSCVEVVSSGRDTPCHHCAGTLAAMLPAAPAAAALFAIIYSTPHAHGSVVAITTQESLSFLRRINFIKRVVQNSRQHQQSSRNGTRKRGKVSRMPG